MLLMLFLLKFTYAARIQRMSVAKLGGLPYIKRPIRKTFAAIHKAQNTDATPMTIESHTCQRGGGTLEAIRRSIANVLTGGKKLIVTLSVELGSADIGIQRISSRSVSNWDRPISASRESRE